MILHFQNNWVLSLILLFFFSCSDTSVNPKKTVTKKETLYNGKELGSVIHTRKKNSQDTIFKKNIFYKTGRIKKVYYVDKFGLKQGRSDHYDSLTANIICTINFVDGESKGDKYIYNKDGKRIQYYHMLNDSTFEKMRKYNANEIFFYEFRKGDKVTYFGNHLEDTIMYSTDYSKLKFLPKPKIKKHHL